MRLGLFLTVFGLLLVGPTKLVRATDTPAAERTRNKLLKIRVTVDAKNVSLRELLKEFAAQVEMKADRPVMWTYAPEVDGGQKITYACTDKPLDTALAEVCKLAGIGYVVASKEDHKHDGWVRITKGDERGYGKYPAEDTAPADPDEAKAANRLKTAKELVDGGMAADAKAVLQLIIDKHPKTKAAAEAKALLEKLNK